MTPRVDGSNVLYFAPFWVAAPLSARKASQSLCCRDRAQMTAESTKAAYPSSQHYKRKSQIRMYHEKASEPKVNINCALCSKGL